MSTYGQGAYKNLVSALEKHRKLKSNLVVLTLPGLGGAHLFKSYWKKNKKKVSYIDDNDGKVGEFNLLNLGLDRKPGGLVLIEDYVKKAGLDNKFAILVHNPSLIQTKEYKGSYLANHVYAYYYLGVRSLGDIELMVEEVNPNLNKANVEVIFELSGGIAQLAKYLAVNWSKNPDFNKGEINNILEPLIRVIYENKPEDLIKLGILDEKNRPVSQLLKSRVEIKANINVVINFDLSFTEDEKPGEEKLTAVEGQILEKMKQNGGSLTKEEASDIKWGEGKYDDYSDQAINKTMRRLDEKLKIYTIATIPKMGFILKRR